MARTRKMSKAQMRARRAAMRRRAAENDAESIPGEIIDPQQDEVLDNREARRRAMMLKRRAAAMRRKAEDLEEQAEDVIEEAEELADDAKEARRRAMRRRAARKRAMMQRRAAEDKDDSGEEGDSFEDFKGDIEEINEEKEARRRAMRRRAMQRRAQDEEESDDIDDQDLDELEGREAMRKRMMAAQRRRAAKNRRRAAMMQRRAQDDADKEDDIADFEAEQDAEDEKEGRRHAARKRALAKARRAMRKRANEPTIPQNDVAGDLSDPNGDGDIDIPTKDVAGDLDDPIEYTDMVQQEEGGLMPDSVNEAEDKVVAAYNLIEAQIARKILPPDTKKAALASKYARKYTTREMKLAASNLSKVGSQGAKKAGRGVRVSSRSAMPYTKTASGGSMNDSCLFW